MAQPATTTISANSSVASAHQELRRAHSDAPTRPNRGLDTGARGWRFAVPSARSQALTR